MAPQKNCRFCLLIDDNVSVLNNVELERFINNIMRQHGFHQDLHEPSHVQYVCWECKALLIKSYKFIKRALLAEKVLQDIPKKSKELTVTSLQSIDRHKLNLNSCLSFHQNKIDFCFYNDLNENAEPEYEVTTKNNIKEENEENDEICCVKDENDLETLTHEQHVMDSSSITLDQDLIKDEENDKEMHDSDPLNIDLSVRDMKPVVSLETITENDSNIKYTNERKSEYVKINKKPNKNANSYTNKKTSNRKCYKQNNKSKKKNKCKSNNSIIDKDDNSASVGLNDTDTSLKFDQAVKKTRKRRIKYVDTNTSESDTDTVTTKMHKRSKKKDDDDDDDYQPSNVTVTEESNSSEYEYDDNTGKRTKKPKDTRTYPMKCDHCDYVIELKKVHYYHYLQHHTDAEYPYHLPALYQCQYCGVKKTILRTLRDHERTHGEKKIQCPDCMQKFHKYSKLYVHIRTKHRGLCFICDYCNKKFPHKCDLKLHIRTHTGEKPFSCHICGAAYAHRGNVKIHILNVHQNYKKETDKQTNKRKRTKKNIDSDSSNFEVKKRDNKKRKKKTK